jgi:hypothetical protein
MNRLRPHARALGAAAAIVVLSSLAVVGGASAGSTLTTKITHAAIHPSTRTARFSFKVVGGGKGPVAIQFFCGLVRQGSIAGPASSCMSPAAYTKLKNGSYSFRVYAESAGGKNTNVATDDFELP